MSSVAAMRLLRASYSLFFSSPSSGRGRWTSVSAALLMVLAVLVLVPASPAEAQNLGPNDCHYWTNDGPISLRYQHTGSAEHRAIVDGQVVAVKRWGTQGDVQQFQLRLQVRSQRFELAMVDGSGNETARKLCTERVNLGRVTGVQCNYQRINGLTRITFVHTGEPIHKLVIGRLNVQTYLGGQAGDQMSYVTDQVDFRMRLVVRDADNQFVEKSRCTNSLLDPPQWPETPGSIVRCTAIYDNFDNSVEFTFENGGAPRYVFFARGARVALVKNPVGQTGTVDVVDVTGPYYKGFAVAAKTQSGELIARTSCATTFIN